MAARNRKRALGPKAVRVRDLLAGESLTILHECGDFSKVGLSGVLVDDRTCTFPGRAMIGTRRDGIAGTMQAC